MSAAPGLRRLGQPQHIAEVVAFLCGHRAAWVTGTIVDGTGGLR